MPQLRQVRSVQLREKTRVADVGLAVSAEPGPPRDWVTVYRDQWPGTWPPRVGDEVEVEMPVFLTVLPPRDAGPGRSPRAAVPAAAGGLFADCRVGG